LQLSPAFPNGAALGCVIVMGQGGSLDLGQTFKHCVPMPGPCPVSALCGSLVPSRHSRPNEFSARLGACQTEATATVVSSDDSLDLERKHMPPLPCWGCTSSLSSLPQPCRYHQTTFSAQYTVQALGTGPTMARFRWRFQGAYLYLHWVPEGAGRICSWDLDMGLIAWQLSRQRLRAAACLT
jgi:hypothetical protein